MIKTLFFNDEKKKYQCKVLFDNFVYKLFIELWISRSTQPNSTPCISFSWVGELVLQKKFLTSSLYINTRTDAKLVIVSVYLDEPK